MMYIAIGGSIGAILRYGFVVYGKRVTSFPFYTIVVNSAHFYSVILFNKRVA